MEYIEASSQESHGTNGAVGIKVMLSIGRDLTDNDRLVLRRAVDKISDGIYEENIRLDPKTALAAYKEKSDILALFQEPIFIKEIPNEYCNRYCCKHLPWFIVTTTRGPITIGWRKRVLQIDWCESDIDSAAEKLFPDEDVTKGIHYIHAWGLEKAAEYIQTILTATE